MRRILLLLLVFAMAAAAAMYGMSHDPLDAMRLGPQRPPPAPPFDPEGPQVRALLDAPLPPWFRVRGRRDECYEQVARATGADVRPAWTSMMMPWSLDALRHDEIDEDLGGVPLREALLRLAAPGPKAKEKPGLIFNGKTITVTTSRAAEADRENKDPSLQLITRVYPVVGLLPVPNSASQAERQARLAEVLSVLDTEAHVYAPHDGIAGRVRELGGQLIVTQTPGTQADVAWALERMRWSRHVYGWSRRVALGVISFALLAVGFRIFRRHRRAVRRLAAGQCVACGYDLRASPGGCPECGLAVRRRPIMET
jgi:hypothetical protein